MTDRTLQIWERLSDMSDKIIEESVIPVEAAPAAAKRTREKGKFSAFMNHPAVVAVLCAVVSLGVVAAIVMAGRGSWDVPPGINPTGSEQIEEETDILDVYGHIFCVGRTLDEIKKDAHALGMNTSTHLGYTYVAVNESAFLLVRSDEMGYVFAVRSYQHKTPTRADYASLKPGMELSDVTKIMGSLGGYANTSGSLSFAYILDDGEMVWISYHIAAVGEAYYGRLPVEEIQPPQESETRYEPTEQVRDYTLIPHTPTAGINDKYFKISMTATEPGKVLTASASYRLYRLHGDEEELIHDYDVELAVYEEPASPDAYAVYETGVSLVWAKSNLEAKGDTLTPGWYRVKFGRATLDFELVDQTGQTPEVHPFAELPVPVSVYTSFYTEDMALSEQYERIYKSANKIEKLWAFFTKLTVTEASPPEHIRSGDSLGIHVTYPDGSNGSIHFWGEQYVYFYIDDGPWYQAPPEEVAALMTQIKNVPSDPT